MGNPKPFGYSRGLERFDAEPARSIPPSHSVDYAGAHPTSAVKQQNAVHVPILFSCSRRPLTDDPRRHQAQSAQTGSPELEVRNRLRCCTRKQLEQMNSSARWGITITESSSPDRSAPGSSKKFRSLGSSSTVAVDDAGRVGASSRRADRSWV